jgi:acyl-CoA reductase-like NAD-dependent aldehyde dehydrogenase
MRLTRITFGAFYQSGQSCVGVQRILVHEDIYERFRDGLVAEAKKMKAGDPNDEDTFIGPMISEKEATRIDGWVQVRCYGGGEVTVWGNQARRDAFRHVA